MTTSRHQVMAGILACTALAGCALLAAQVSAQDDSEGGHDWEIVAGHPAGYGYSGGGQWPGSGSGGVVQSQMFLYNKRTGKAYRYFPGCTSGGEAVDEGCFFLIQALDRRVGFQVRVQPTGGTAAQR